MEITPPKGAPMGGYLGHAEPAEDVHDPLFARALVLDDGRQRVAILSADLPEVSPAFAADVRRRIEQELGVPAANTLFTVTHTHAGPLVVARPGGSPDVLYLENLRDKLVGAVRAALRTLRPARVGAGRAKVHLGVNRRELAAQARVVMGRNPAGYASPYAYVLAVVEEGRGPIAILFTCGAHPVVLGPENRAISGDYAGCAERVVEENFGGLPAALFAIGFAGNVNVNCSRRDFDEVETIGSALGRAVLEELKVIRPVRGLGLAVRSQRVALPTEPVPSRDEAERRLYLEREALASILGRGEDKAEINRRRLRVEWAARLVQVASQPESAAPVELEVQGIAIGPTALVGASAEVFAEYEKALQGASPFALTIPVGCANGTMACVPTAAAFDEGGYEVETAPCLFGTLRLSPEVEAVVQQAFARVLVDLTG